MQETRRIQKRELAQTEILQNGRAEAFCFKSPKIISATPKPSQPLFLKSSWIDTPLGTMLALSDESALYLLEFVGNQKSEAKIERLSSKFQAVIEKSDAKPLAMIEKELKAYFSGRLKCFQTPVHLLGSPFQQQVWKALLEIPYGESRSYAIQAKMIGKQTAYRAVANANGANQLAIVLPCHRVINSSGALGGYAGGITRKKWLLEHEASYSGSSKA